MNQNRICQKSKMDLGSFGDPDGLEHQMKCYIAPNDDDLSFSWYKDIENNKGYSRGDRYTIYMLYEVYFIQVRTTGSIWQKPNAGHTDWNVIECPIYQSQHFQLFFLPDKITDLTLA